MGDRVVTLTVEIPETIQGSEAVLLSGMVVSLTSDDVNPEVVPAVILKAVEYLVQGRLAEAYATSMPMLNEELVDILSASEARLALIDTVLHLPTMGNGQHIETIVPK